MISILQANLRDLRADGLEEVPDTGRVTGFIVSRDFCDMDDNARQDRLWQLLEKDLKPTELQRIGPIVLLTPAEAEIDLTVDRVEVPGE